MADDRPAQSEIQTIAQLRRDVDDLRSTVLARVSRRPAGAVEPTILEVAPPDTLLLQGQLVLRDVHPVLWQWVQDNGRVKAGLFTAGDGSTTFGLPDLRGRVLLGAGTLGPDTYAVGQLVGAASRVLTEANLPSHDHNVGVAAHATHDHNVATSSGGSHFHAINSSTGSAGSHGGHVGAGASPNANAPEQQTSYTVSAGSHTHAIDTDTGTTGAHTHAVTEALAGPTTHTVTESLIGSGTAVDVRQPGIAVGWLIWT